MGIEVAIFGYMVSLSTIITVASIAYQISQARKMRKAAAAAAEARKGFELVVEGEAVHLPLIYGRAKVGGVRVYHNIANNFNYVTPNSDKAFVTDGFNGNLIGEKNEYLFFQQALCQGPINAIYDVVFEESRYLNDSDISNSSLVTYDAGSNVGDTWVSDIQTRTDLKSGIRIDLHYGNTPIADSIMTANFSDRRDSKFTIKKNDTGLAYASVIIKLNRDQPQFNGVPLAQFFIEGRKVKSVVRTGTAPNYTYSLSSTRTYSNNPALCLLDYLTDDVSGKSLALVKLDLKSFYDSAIICDTTVQSSTLVGGKIWQTTDGYRNVSTRALPLYECNIIVDTEKPIRENVESILSTMGDARLVWSGGKYKLNLQYPTSNAAINVATTLTDDDLVLDDDIQINWPSSSERLNHCIVRFHNESENFKEDTVSWPPKTSGNSLRGIGGFKYPVRGNFESSTSGGQLLNSYAVWSGSTSSTTLNYKFVVKESGTYTLQYTGDDTIAVTITNTSTGIPVLTTGVRDDLGSVKTASVPLIADTIYSVLVVGGDTGGEKGVAAKLTLNNFIVWTTRSDAYTDFISTTTTSAIYDTMKTEDGGLEFETDIFAEGVTDYYHALAKAEELVRTSRTAFGITFKYIIKNNFLEPGDFIRLNSTTLKLGGTTPLYLRVNQVKVSEESTCEVTATRFDYTQLAWNVKDDEYLKPANVYNFTVDQPRNLVFTAESVNILSSVGSLNWDDSSSPEFASFIIYMYKPGNVLADGTILWTELGRSSESQFTLPALTLTSAIFGVRTLTKQGKLSEITTTGLITLTPAVSSIYVMSLSNDSISLTCDKLGVPNAGQLPKTVTIKVTKGDTELTTGVTYGITAVGCTATILGNTITITAVASQYAKISVTATIGTLVLTKEISISKSNAGTTSVTGLLTNEAATVSAATDGTVASFANTGGTFKVFDGIVDKTGDAAVVYSINSSTGVTIEIAATGVYTISAMSADTGTATLRAVYNGITIDKVYSIAKSKTGAGGSKSVAVYLYQWASTQPSNPTGTSTYTWSTAANATYTGANNWQVTVPTNPGTPLLKLWIATRTITALSSATSTDVDWTTNVNVSSFSQNGSAGINGLNVAQVKLYKPALTIPAGPTGTNLYTWASGSYSYSGLNSWTTSPPTSSVGLNGQTLWVAVVNLSDSSVNLTTTINWVTASIVAESYYAVNGVTPVKGVDYFDGINGTSIKVQYSANNSSWHDTPLAGDLYIRTGTKANGAADYTYGAGVKFVPEKGVEYDDGDPGISSYLHIKYSNDNGSTFTANGGETVGDYIGTYTDSTAADSTSVSSYTWAKIKGEPGAVSTTPGPQGASARVAYAVTTTTPSSTPSSLTVAGDSLPTAGTWFPGVTWQTASPASLTAGQFLYQVDGLYNPAAGVNSTTWQGIPYLSALKVGSLSAITTNTGNLTVTDTIKVGTGASTTNGVLITTNGIEIYNNSVLRVKLGNI